jgi:Asp-tRNA(Asn)/Glu-tRNA(Gln) amidotransferase A subunit family amidase
MGSWIDLHGPGHAGRQHHAIRHLVDVNARRMRCAGQLFPALCLPLDVLHIGPGLLHRGELSPAELVESRLSRIEKLDGTLHCFIWLMTEEACAAARTAEAEIIAAAGADRCTTSPWGGCRYRAIRLPACLSSRR